MPTYASAAYGCALAHSSQTTREVRATFYSRLNQYGPHAAPCKESVTCVGPRGWSPGVARPVSIGPHRGWGRSHRRSIHSPLWDSIPRGTRFMCLSSITITICLFMVTWASARLSDVYMQIASTHRARCSYNAGRAGLGWMKGWSFLRRCVRSML